MKFKQNGAVAVIAVALLAVGYGVYSTSGQTAIPARTARRGPSYRPIAVDQSSLATAEQLVRMPTTAEERPFAEDALHAADQEMDLAFAQAVRRTFNQPPATSPDAREASARLQQSLHAVASDQAQVAALSAQAGKTSTAGAESSNDRLNLLKAQAALDQDEADDARQDLRRAGGDPQGRIQDVIAEHDAASKSSDSVHVVVTAPVAAPGLINHLQALQTLRAKARLVRRAGAAADSLAGLFKARHDSIEAHAAARARDSSTAPLSHDSSIALLASTQRRALEGKIRATLDQRVDNQQRLSDAYTGWTAVLGAQQRTLINRVLRSVAAILVIVLIAMFFARWLAHLLGTRAVDGRRMQTLYMVARVSVQLAAALFILLVIFGPPNNIGTMLGLAGAGLTVALREFILGFIGWFILMGKNGIRIGDLVEINDVTGEVVELGMFYTVLLETGDWTESGHPTGRRVTFTNGFAIEGHYFNFSTSGRWLWDDVRIVVPAPHDPYPIAEALKKQIEAATAESAREADAQWKEAWRSTASAVPTAGPSVTLRPIAEGIEITVRYITRATERESLRAGLYQTAVGMLGGANAAAPA